MDQILGSSSYHEFVNESTSASSVSTAGTAGWTAPRSVLPSRYVDSSAARAESVVPEELGSTSSPFGSCRKRGATLSSTRRESR
jgi:hypothetical protein